jgi:hypothetical protein
VGTSVLPHLDELLLAVRRDLLQLVGDDALLRPANPSQSPTAPLMLTQMHPGTAVVPWLVGAPRARARHGG